MKSQHTEDGQPLTLIELLRWRAQHQPDQQVYTFLDADEAKKVRLTYRELDQRASAIAARLQSISARGERSLLLYPPGLEFIVAFFGCLYAGVIAVPAYPPRLNRNLLRVQAIIADAAATVTMTTTAILSKVKTMIDRVPDLKQMRWLDTESIEGGLDGVWKEIGIDREDLAFLQYTSGSTGSPKGVMLTHGNLLHNASLVHRAFDHVPTDIYVSWLPTFHDMGFMAGVLQPLYGGFPVVLMSPAAFLQSPIRWLQAITDYRGTTSGAPNFAYDLCARKIPRAQRETLDLSSWSVAVNGAEPIRNETLERFVAAFEPYGFRREVFCPCYGLAEATLIVSGGSKGEPAIVKTFQAGALGKNHIAEIDSRDDENARTLVGCGHVLFEQQVVIVNPESLMRCAPDEVGEIWVSGPSVAQGYWNRPEQTEQTFRAQLTDTGEGPFLRTQDLGFLRDGELFVTGRIKDLVIIRGRNHYPQDIELTVERSHPALRTGCGAAFSIDLDDEERLVVVQEIESLPQAETESAIEAIRRAVAEEHELQVYAVVLIKPGSAPKTSSGKIQRHACRNAYLSRELKTIERSVLSACDAEPNRLSLTREEVIGAASNSRQALLESYLQDQVARVLKVRPSQVSSQLPLNSLGIDSLMSIELQYNIEATFGVSMPMASFLQDTNLVSLAAQILAQLSAHSEPARVLAHTGEEVASYPLSYGQQSLWFLYHLAPESAAYNIARAVRILSPLDVRAFRASFQQLVDRHPSLRTTFPASEGRPFQLVHESGEVSFQEEDAVAWTEEMLKERLAEESQRSFDLENGPLFRLVLFTRSPHERVLLLAMHHIVADFWSLAVLMQEFGILYQARKTGAEAVLPLPATTYVDYAAWQARLLDGPEGGRLWAYWQKQLAGGLHALDLPTDRPRPAVQTYRGSSRSIWLSKQLTEALKSLGRTRGATLYMTLLAAFQALLHRYTRASEVSVGSTMTGRSRGEFAGVVGYFVNPVVLCASLSGDPTFEEFLDQVRQVVLAAFEHQDYPFALLVERLQPQRDPARSPLFQAMFVLQKSHLMNEAGLASFALGEEGARLTLGALEFASMSLEQRVAQFDLTLMMTETGEGLAASLEYNADIFDSASIMRMLRHFETLLENLAAHPEQRLSGLSLLTAAERHQLLVQWNDTQANYPRNVCLHQLFEAQAARTPQRIAVVSGDERLTYAELDRRANQLANYLRRQGIGEEILVGICVERTVEMVVGLLAILKAGGAYVPLDPTYPKDRLSFIVNDAQMKVLLTRQHLLIDLPAAEGAQVISLDSSAEPISTASESQPESGVCADNLAYVIYTSGSTGTPKGVGIAHRAVVNFLHAMREQPGLTDSDVVLAVTSLSFDIAGLELFLPLMVGARLELASRQEAADGLKLMARLRESGATVLQATPTCWELLLDAGWHNNSRRFKALCGGETFPRGLATQLLEEHAPIWNLYGPTETTIWSTMSQVADSSGSIPIGRPIANTQVYITDVDLSPTAIGLPGELYIGGEGLARGYLGRPGLTAEKFIPDPFSDRAGARLYRTGDVARYLPNSEIEFLGRSDQQVKIRGFRIEVGEIEAALSRYQGVRQAVVSVREDVPGEKRLVAYIVWDVVEGAESTRPNASALRSHLKHSLPDYMLPAVFVDLEQLPLTPNGKIDRRALPAPDRSRPGLDKVYVEARTDEEALLVEIWKNVLGVERVGIHDNFFELGGDSILSIQFVNRVRQAGILVTPRQLFQHQTVAELAALATAERPHQTTARDRFEQRPVIGSLPLTPVQRWLFENDFPNPHHWNQAILLEARQALDPSLLEKALQELISHHDTLRLRFTRQGCDWQQLSADASEQVSCCAIDLSGLTIEEYRSAIEAEATAVQSSLDISQGPLCRAAYFYSVDEHPSRLLLVIHHLAVDAVSWRILLEDLEAAYWQLSLGETVQLPPKTISFAQWAESLGEYARSPELERDAAYWLNERPEKCSRLPVDLDGGPNTEASTRTISVSLNEEETWSLLHELPRAYLARINELLLSALAQTLTRWASGALVVDLEGHGREEIFEGCDTSRTVGWFTSIFPVVLEAVSEEESSALDRLKRVKEQLRRLPQKGVGYGVLRYLSGDVSLREQLCSPPQPEVSFNYLDQLDQVFARSRLFKQTAQEIGPTRDPQGRRRYLLEINGSIVNGRLQFNWAYSENLHHRDTIEKLALEFTAALKSLIGPCASGEANCYTPSDFPLTRLDQLTLDQLAQRYGQLEDIYPLSPIQRGMLFHSLYAPASGVYVQQLSLTLRGKLDVAAFERAWQQVAQRHATLRTAFVWENLDEPLQLVQRRVSVPWERNDWRSLPAKEQQAKLAAHLDADRARGFELSKSPVMRMMLCQLTDKTYQMVWSYHHLMLDGWSLPIILKEFVSLYESSLRDYKLRLDPAQPYCDYIHWLQQQDLVKAEAFWRETLAGFHAPTPLGGDNARRSTAREGGRAEQQTRLKSSMTAQLRSFARQHQLTLNTLLLGAWALMLSRYSGEQDVVFGATVSGRSAELIGAERIVGPFINTVPVRVRMPASARTLDWLRELQERQAELRDYEYTPLVQIQGWSDVPRSLPLFESIFVFENYPVDDSLRDLKGNLRIDKIDFFEQTNYPLTVIAVPGSELLLKVMYDPERFDDATVSRLFSHFENLLTGILANPAQPISQLPLLSSVELTRLLTEWNNTQVEYPRDKCIHEWIEARAASSPEAGALVFEKEKLSYRELNERANQLAHHLRQQGVGPESLVGVLMERSVEQVVALLGVLKAGGAYVPLDPAYPRERLAYMLADSRVEVLLTQERLAGVLPPTPARAIYLDTAWEQIVKTSTGNPALVVTADNLAYIIYTSGSTGRPKGAANTHGAILNRLLWMQETYRLTPDDRVLQKTPFSFDVSVWEFFWPLMFGAQLVVARPGGHQDNAYIVNLIARQGITTLHFVPSMLQLFVEEPGLEKCRSLRQVICSGEALPYELQQRFFARLPETTLHNLYGPTEAAVDVTFWECRQDGNLRTVPIGRPVANTQIYLLDRHMHPVPEGVPGELHIGGVQLARGYHGRPDLTAEKFIPDEFGSVAGRRLYKTGDLVRYLAKGELEFLGRIDHQVKVRGFRIELGEIEARLVEQPGVREAVVVAREDTGGQKLLVGYVACAKEETPSQSELRKRLRETLPEYMVPSAIVLMAELPLTPNGKIDRKALPAAEDLLLELTEDLVAPRTPLERALANIWRDVLGLKGAGVHGNFFELGGNSLLAMQLLSHLRRVLHVDLPLRDLMSTATIAEMARLLSSREAAAGQANRLNCLAESVAEAGADHLLNRVIPTRQADGELPLSFAQQRLWFLCQLQPEVSLYNCPAAVRIKGRLNQQVLVGALNEIIRRHEILRTNFPMTENGNPVQRILQARVIIPQVVDLRTLTASEREDEARRLMVKEARKRFDLAQDQLLRVMLLNLDHEDTVLMLTAHHIIVDAWSMGVLVGELATLYQAFSTNSPSPLPELAIQYADFALWQREWLQGEVLAEQSRYWRRVLGGKLPMLELPVGRLSTRPRSHLGERRIFLLGPELAAALNSLSRLEGVTLYMTLLAAFQTLLHRYTKQDDIIVGTAIANRPLDEVKGLIGCFINTLALRTDFSGSPTFRELLQQVRELSLGAFSHQDMPFDKLVAELEAERSLSETPIVQVAFGIQNSPMQALELPGLKLTPVEVDDGIARLDLTLWIEESADGLKAAWTYSADLFDAPAIERLHAHYETLLRSIVAHPERRVDALDMLTEPEKKQVEAQGRKRAESNHQRLLKVRPRAVSTPQEIVKD